MNQPAQNLPSPSLAPTTAQIPHRHPSSRDTDPADDTTSTPTMTLKTQDPVPNTPRSTPPT